MNTAAHLIGAFYIFAGIVVLRAMVLDSLMDKALEALTLKPTAAAERTKAQILSSVSVLTLLGGVTLALLSRWALVFFVLNALAQALYIFWSGRALPPEDALEVQGRRQTINAFFIYCGATAFVFACYHYGVFAPWRSYYGVPPLAAELIVPLIVSGLLALPFILKRKAANKMADEWGSPDENDGQAAEDARELSKEWGGDIARQYSGKREVSLPPMSRIRIKPEYGAWPLWNTSTGNNLHPLDIGLSEEIFDRIHDWNEAFQATIHTGFATDEARRAHEREGAAIAALIRADRPTITVIEDFAEPNDPSR